MNSIIVNGGYKLYGSTGIQGSKNAALPIITAAVLVKGVSVIHNCPQIADVFYMIKILECIGCRINWEGHTLIIDASTITATVLPCEYVTKMRSSVVLMGALLGRVREVTIDYPGGCVIGDRPIDLHLSGLQLLGTDIVQADRQMRACCTQIEGNTVTLSISSVGATENLILAAVLGKGVTKIVNAAKEPEIIALCEFLKGAGARITGEGTEEIHIEGVEQLWESEFEIPADRIVAGTYVLACMAIGGEIELVDAPKHQLKALLSCITQMNGRYYLGDRSMLIKAQEGHRKPIYVKTMVYPGFPTDLQSQILVPLAITAGESIIEETIFENRFRIVEQLNGMGANIEIQGKRLKIQGVETLNGKELVAEELRGGAALVMAGLAAEGVSVIKQTQFIQRGYQNIEADLKNLGAHIITEAVAPTQEPYYGIRV